VIGVLFCAACATAGFCTPIDCELDPKYAGLEGLAGATLGLDGVAGERLTETLELLPMDAADKTPLEHKISVPSAIEFKIFMIFI
jgi:hypothetical protein